MIILVEVVLVEELYEKDIFMLDKICGEYIYCIKA